MSPSSVLRDRARKKPNGVIILTKTVYAWRGSVLLIIIIFILHGSLFMNTDTSLESLYPAIAESNILHNKLVGHSSTLRASSGNADTDNTESTPTVVIHDQGTNADLPVVVKPEFQRHEAKDTYANDVSSAIAEKEKTSEATSDRESKPKISTTDDGKADSSSSLFKSDYYDICIIGAGLSGAVIAEQYASHLGKRSLILEKRDHIGGNCYDYIDPDTNILVNKYGAHLFHTQYYRVWEYIQQFSEWTPYEHRVLGRIGDKDVPIPVNIDTVNILFDLNITSVREMDAWLSEEQQKYDHDPINSEEMAMSRVGERLYNMIFKPYTIKQWAKTPKELGPEVTARIPVRNDWDDRYFPNDVFQALPTHGYTKIFENLIMNNPLIETHVNVDYFDVREELASRSMCGHTFFSGPIDAYFAKEGYEKLEYRSLNFEKKIVKDIGNDKYFLPASVVNYPSADYDFTRIVEYKHLLKQESPDTIIFYERSNDDGEPYYPVPNKKNQDLYEKYQKMALEEPNVTFVGRLANYKYFNMDQSILNALELFDANAPRITIMQACKEDTGGPEALVQLASAFHAWMPSRTFVTHYNNQSKFNAQLWAERGYKEFVDIPVIEMTSLIKGDILIMHDLITQCPKDLIEKGVKVFVWKLGVPLNGSRIQKFLKDGCQFLSHNYYTMSDIESVDYKLPRSHILIPYIRRKKIHSGLIKNDKRENLILYNHIHPDQRDEGFVELSEHCKKASCEVIMLKGFNEDELKSLYQKAKIIVGDCLKGSERSVIEAVLAGALFVTSNCLNGKDLRDFPIPRQHKFSNKFSRADVATRLMDNFEEEQQKLEGFRRLYKHYSHETLVEDAKRFFHAVV